MQEKQKNSITLVAIGDELLNGKISDTNSAYIAASLKARGIAVRSVQLVADSIPDITAALRAALSQSSYCICTGGLGPTSDDRTRHAIAALAGTSLSLDQESLQRLENYAKLRQRVLNENNRTQAYFPTGARIIENPRGTANAFETRIGNETFVLALPGVPAEMKAILESYAIERLDELFPERQKPRAHSFRLFGIPESELGEKIDALGLDENVIVSYRPQLPEILLECAILRPEYENLLEAACEQVHTTLGQKIIFSTDARKKLPETVADLLHSKKKTIALAESCSGGLLADAFVHQAGASQSFLGSIVSYSNSAKASILGVDEGILRDYGAVSEECAIAMAQNARQRFSSDFALSITGIAGPDGGSEEKPVGTVWIALSGNETTKSEKLFLPLERTTIRRYAVHAALQLLRLELLKE